MTIPATIRVLIVDSHEGVRLGLTIALATAEDMLVVGQATSGAEALRLCGESQPDVVLMDLLLPDQAGMNVIRLIRHRFPHIQVVVLTTLQTEELRQQSLAAGARGYLQKYVAVDELIEVIRAANVDPFVDIPSCRREEDKSLKGRSGDQSANQLIRLRRIEGQIRGVQRMVEEGRDCLDVVTQLQAISAATTKVAEHALESHIRLLVTEAIREQRGEEAISELMQVLDKALTR